MGDPVTFGGGAASVDYTTSAPAETPKVIVETKVPGSGDGKTDLPSRDLNFTEPTVIYGGNVKAMQFKVEDLQPKTTTIKLAVSVAVGVTDSKSIEIEVPWPSPPPKTAAGEREALDKALAVAVTQMKDKYGIGRDRGATGNLVSMFTPTSSGFQGCASAASTGMTLVSALETKGLLKFHAPDAEREQPYNVVWAHKGFSIREKATGALYAVDFWKDPSEYGKGDKGRVMPLEVWAPARGTIDLANMDAIHIPTVLEQSLSKSFTKLAPNAGTFDWQKFRTRFSNAGGNLENIKFDPMLAAMLHRPNMTEAEWAGIKQTIRDDARRIDGVPSSWQAAIQTIIPKKMNPD